MFSDRFGTATVEMRLPDVPGVRFYAPRSVLVAAKRKPFFRACGRCFSIFVCAGKKRRTLPKTRGAPTAPETGCAVQATTPPLRRARSESRRTAHAFWATPSDCILLYGPKAQ